MRFLEWVSKETGLSIQELVDTYDPDQSIQMNCVKWEQIAEQRKGVIEDGTATL